MLLKHYLKKDRELFFRFMRMTPERFEHLLGLVQPRIEKQDTNFHRAIKPAARLALTLLNLGSEESQQSFSFSFRMGRTTVSQILSETSDAIFQSLKEPYIKCPNSPEDWKAISQKFEEYWNVPHAVGAIDGKHIRIQCPDESGTLYHNYKGFFSIVLLAACDADYCLTLFDIGSYGSNNDSGVLAKSLIGQLLENGNMKLPQPQSLPSCSFEPIPYFLLGDDICPLKTWLMRPYPGFNLSEEERVYNYRHSRGRHVIENIFGILVARWRIFLTSIRASVENVEKYVLACLALHNYLRQTSKAPYTPNGFADSEDNDCTIYLGEWRNQLERNDSETNCIRNIRGKRGSRPREETVSMRDALKDYFNSNEGSVPWQLSHVRRTYKK